MKFWYLILVCCVWPAQQAAAACVFSGNLSVFEPGIAQLADDPSLPAPELESLDVTRGLNGGASCDQMGFMSVKLRWPRGSRFDLDEIGFEYRLVQGSAPEGLVPSTPMTSPSSGRKAEHLITWLDGTPAQQQALNLLLEVRAVTPDRRRGPPMMVQVVAAPGS
ncbi:hypothetical protein [Pseudoxanthomonas koreensis]|uniref:hypothetical protein n=1 Tax=Pseudoxanthomonas koreensis TaxID=266061 RepID=UPI0035A661F0